jgi:hypothetical protein
MQKNSFANRLQLLLKQSNTKNATLAKCVQYDLSYISKWLSGKMLPSDKNIEQVIERIVECFAQGDTVKLCSLYSCDEHELREYIASDLHEAYRSSKSPKTENSISVIKPLSEVVGIIVDQTCNHQKAIAVIDLFSMPHENRLLLAGIKNGHFVKKEKKLEYHMIINAESNDCVYDSIFMIHMLTSMSDIDFKLYNSRSAFEKILFCTGNFVITGLLLSGSTECISVNEIVYGNDIQQRIISLLNQENLIFRKSSIQSMIQQREYIQTLISTNIRWVLGHATELILPADVFKELMKEDNRDTSDYLRLYQLSQRVLFAETSQIMIYESAIANLAVDGIIDFYNRPVQLNPDQILRTMEYYLQVGANGNIRLIDGGFSDDFRYITNPCMFLSDSLCYVRLENNRYDNNILILNDRTVKATFDNFFAAVWENRKDVVTEEKAKVVQKIDHYKKSSVVLFGTEIP